MTHSANVAIPADELVPPKSMLFDGSSSPEEFIARRQISPRDQSRLTQILATTGGYDGVDVHRESVAWLQNRYRAHPNFHFHHIDVHNVAARPIDDAIRG